MDAIADIQTFLSAMDFGHNNPLKILDIGAHSGKFTQAIKDRYPDAKSFMFEPSPEQFENLVSAFPDDFVFNYGLSDCPKKSHFVLYGGGGGISQLNRLTTAAQVDPLNQLIEVQVVSLDSIHPHIMNCLTIDICKIDTEGQELNVIKGARQMLSERAISYIIFEVGSTYTALGYTFNDVISMLNSYGYLVYTFQNGKPVEVKESTDYQLWDYLATYKPV